MKTSLLCKKLNESFAVKKLSDHSEVLVSYRAFEIEQFAEACCKLFLEALVIFVARFPSNQANKESPYAK